MLSRGYYNLSGNSPMLTESEFNTQFYRIKGGGGVPPSPLPPHTHTPQYLLIELIKFQQFL